MRSGLVGHTGIIGDNPKTQMKLKNFFNRNNIHKSSTEKYDILICVAPSVKKKLANKLPKKGEGF